jgi:hypothetical protein
MLAFLVGFAFLIATLAAHANGRTLVFVNGYELTPEELYSVQLQSGSRIPPGNYIYDGRTGCWAELNSGRSDCPAYAAGGSYGSRYGSGEWNGDFRLVELLTASGRRQPPRNYRPLGDAFAATTAPAATNPSMSARV